MRLEHIGVAVRNLEDGIKIFEKIFNKTTKKVEEVPDEKVKIASIELDGFEVELLEPIGDNSTVKKFLDKRGEGVHHIAFKVKSIDSFLKHTTTVSPPKIVRGRKIVFLNPKTTNGVLIELME